jgi:hypothetical protein
MLRSLWGLVYYYPISDSEKDDVEKRAKLDVAEEKMSAWITTSIREVEARTAVYLSHISLMIAVAGLFAANADGTSKYFFGFELLAYLILAICCLRCQVHLGTKSYTLLKPKESQSLPSGGGIAARGMPDEDLATYIKTPQSKTVSERTQYERRIKGELVYRERLARLIIPILYLLTAGLACLVFLELGLSDVFEI